MDEVHAQRVIANGYRSRVSDNELSQLREQAEFMALGGQNSATSWAKVAEAMKELEERRARDAHE